MNFLELAQRTRQEIGASGVGPANVAGQSGYSAKIIDWVQDAYHEVQTSPALQNCLWQQAAAAVVAGITAYAVAVTPEFVRMRVAYILHGSTKMRLDEMSWRAYRDLPSTSQGMPLSYAVSPDNILWLWPTPAAACTLDFEYECAPFVLSGNVDVPVIPKQYHMAIVWRAVMYSAAHDENQALLQVAQANYKAIMNKVAMHELPPLLVAGALA